MAIQAAQKLKINSNADNDASQILEESVDTSMAETTALVSYLTGINAVHSMSKDNFLLTFAPTATSAVLEKFGVKSYAGMNKAIREDTRTLGKITETAIEEMKEVWETECDKARQIKIKAENLITLMAVRSRYLKDPKTAQDNAYITALRNNLINSEENISFFRQRIDSLKSNGEGDERLFTAQLNYEAALESYENAKMSLIALNVPFTANSKTAQGTSSVYLDFILSELDTERQKVIDSFSEYKEKYGCVPEYLEGYVNIINEIQRMASHSAPNTSEIEQIYTNSISQYVDILTDGPKVILSIAKEYPELQEMYDSECDLYYEKENSETGTGLNSNFTSRLKAMNKARYRIPGIHFSALLCSEDKYPQGTLDKTALVIYGKPGIGKTASTEQIAKKLGFYFKSLSIPHIDSSQISGLMAVNENNEVDQFLTKSMGNTVKKYGIFDLEEATASSDIAVRNQMARLLQTGELAEGKKVHPLTIFVLTANDDKDDNAGIKPFSPVLRTRMLAVSLKNKQRLMSGWVNWLNHNEGIQKNPANKAACDMVLMFLRHADDGRKYWFTDGKKQGTVISPNFRTWHKFIMQAGRIIQDEDSNITQKASDLRRLGSHIVGAEAAEKFVDYYSIISKLPDVKTLIDTISSSKKWSALDFIRILDMKGNELAENSDSDSKYKFALKPDSQADNELINNSNKKTREILSHVQGKEISDEELEKSFMYKTVQKDIMTPKVLEEEYNNLWGGNVGKGQDGFTFDMNNSAIMFYFKNRILAEYNNLFDMAERTKQPVDGQKLDKILQLASTIPGKDQRLSLVLQLMDGLQYQESKEKTLMTYGIWYPATKNIPENRIYKLFPTYNKTDKTMPPCEFDKENNVMTVYKPRSSLLCTMTSLISKLSKSYALAQETFNAAAKGTFKIDAVASEK